MEFAGQRLFTAGLVVLEYAWQPDWTSWYLELLAPSPQLVVIFIQLIDLPEFANPIPIPENPGSDSRP